MSGRVRREAGILACVVGITLAACACTSVGPRVTAWVEAPAAPEPPASKEWNFEGCGVNGAVPTDDLVFFEDTLDGEHEQQLVGFAQSYADFVGGPIEFELRFYDDRGAPNALALRQSQVTERMLVALGVEMMGISITRSGDGSPNYVGAATVLAHEVAHIVQFQRGIVGATPRMELMADAVAGWLVVVPLADDGELTVGEQRVLSVAANRLYTMGDYGFTHPDHHGTPEQRREAFAIGLALRVDGVTSFDEVLSITRNHYGL